MANLAPIRKEQHQNLKIAAKRSLKHIAGLHIVPITAAEYAKGAMSFPVFIVNDPETKRFRSVAMLGLETGENLFLDGDNWTALYAPQSVGMAPFALGLDPDKEKTLTACVDLDSEFVGEDKELPLFDESGNETDLMKNVQETLGRLYENEVMTEKFIKEMQDADLLEEVELVIAFANGEKKKIVGVHTIKEPKLRELTDEQVLDFHKRGLFIPIHSMLSSIGQINRLAQLRNERKEEKVAGVQIVPVEK
ncbi:SapC family protein [Thalassotalea sp. M1531]|uniref:SapC family protein n=1 Tax=Thalassotalea algicola TaxID=2716224 RepID=A0A7Y0Q572_9GAMM|nr:SapC family protein [Thalassotalea algicola]NMP30754.1 SapC family protein [Thalassotalea algicola]